MTRTTTLWSLLLLSAALALGSCTKDATEQATGPEPEAKAASKLVFSSENAVSTRMWSSPPGTIFCLSLIHI